MGLNECALLVLHIIAISYAFDRKSAQKLFPEWQQHLAYVDTLRVKEGRRGGGGGGGVILCLLRFPYSGTPKTPKLNRVKRRTGEHRLALKSPCNENKKNF